MFESSAQWMIIGSVVSAVWGLGLYINRGNSSIKNLVFSRTENIEKAILDKLEYHERHDDQRFSSVTNALWELRVDQARGQAVARQKERVSPVAGEAGA